MFFLYLFTDPNHYSERINGMYNMSAINPKSVTNLASLFEHRIQKTPDRPAYRYFENEQWSVSSWAEMGELAAKWQRALDNEGLQAGDRVAVMLHNCREWVLFDQASLGLGLIVVPLFFNDNTENATYILQQTQAKVFLLGTDEQWQAFNADELSDLQTIVVLQNKKDTDHCVGVNDWLSKGEYQFSSGSAKSDDLASIVYTSGTTGRPKGVMLSHWNMLSNAWAAQQAGNFQASDRFLSFLPLSHMFERTAGYYLPMMVGAEVAYTRSIPQLAEDLGTLSPSILISVPRIYERIYAKVMDGIQQKGKVSQCLLNKAIDIGYDYFEYKQKRLSWQPSFMLKPILDLLVAKKLQKRLGGKLRIAVCGGAAFPATISRFFLGLGVPVYQGYGMTECSPIAAVNLPDKNKPASIGLPLQGTELTLGNNDELLIRSESVMQGYWQNPQATAETIDEQGWLHSGDQASIDEEGFVFITGRLKEIIVMTNGEKVPPADVESAIIANPLIEQVMVVGEARSYLSALVVPTNPDSSEKEVLNAVKQCLKPFPGYVQIHRVCIVDEPWSVENGLLTPTLKLKREKIMERYQNEIENLYAE